MNKEENRYWDSCVFLAWLLPENNRVAECETVIRAAERGDVRIITSAVSLTEVIKLKEHENLAESDEDKIERFFENSYITVTNLDRFVAERARQLIWKFTQLKPKDALHLASALEAECSHLDTFDQTLLGLNGRLEGISIHIGTPSWPLAGSLDLRMKDDK